MQLLRLCPRFAIGFGSHHKSIGIPRRVQASEPWARQHGADWEGSRGVLHRNSLPFAVGKLSELPRRGLGPSGRVPYGAGRWRRRRCLQAAVPACHEQRHACTLVRSCCCALVAFRRGLEKACPLSQYWRGSAGSGRHRTCPVRRRAQCKMHGGWMFAWLGMLCLLTAVARCWSLEIVCVCQLFLAWFSLMSAPHRAGAVTSCPSPHIATVKGLDFGHPGRVFRLSLRVSGTQ